VIETATSGKKKTSSTSITTDQVSGPLAGLSAAVSTRWTAFTQLPVVAENVMPVLSVAGEILRVKNVREWNSLLGAGSYAWMLVSAGLLVYGLKRRSAWLTLLAVSSIAFGVATQTGSLELSYYRGRSGWYLMLLSQLGAVTIFDLLYRRHYRWIAYGGLAVLYVGSLFSPPVFYRPYYTAPFTIAKQIELAHPDQPIHFITNTWQLVMVSKNFTTAPLVVGSVQNAPAVAERYIVVEKSFFPVDPVLSQQAYSTDADFTEFNARQRDLHNAATDEITAIRELPEFADYQVYWEDDTLMMYRYTPAE
jgi:hypothetical protein